LIVDRKIKKQYYLLDFLEKPGSLKNWDQFRYLFDIFK